MPTVVAMPHACIIAFFGEERFGWLRIDYYTTKFGGLCYTICRFVNDFDKPECLAYLPLLQNLFMKFATTVRSLHFL